MFLIRPHSYGRPVSRHLQSNETQVGTSYQLNNCSLRISYCSKCLRTVARFRELSLKKVSFRGASCVNQTVWVNITNFNSRTGMGIIIIIASVLYVTLSINLLLSNKCVP